MSKPFDSTTKYLIEAFPRDWLALAGLVPTGPVDLIDANLSTVTAEADKVIRVGGPSPWLAHVEFQSSRDNRLPTRLFRYNALLDDRHDLPTRSIVVLLRTEADGPEVTGHHRRSLPAGPEYLVFRYEVIRAWEQPVESILTGGLGILPLAPVAKLGTMPLEAVVAQMTRRIDLEPPSLQGLLWNSTAIVMGLSHPADLIAYLLRGVRDMKESSWYQYVLSQGAAEGRSSGLAEGLAEGRNRGRKEGLAEGLNEGLVKGQILEARSLMLRVATRRFGEVSSADRQVIDLVTDLDQLHHWTDLVFETSTWAEFWAKVEAN